MTLSDPVKKMAILNLTPDSFSDGGENTETEQALQSAARHIADGADIIDAGAESTRPGALPVSEDEEIARLTPFLEALAASPIREKVAFSIDTYKAPIAEAALKAGFTYVNDVFGGLRDSDIMRVAAEYDAFYMIGHSRDKAEETLDIIEDIKTHLTARIDAALQAGVKARHIILDPGIGFGKTFRQNLLILNRIADLKSALGGFPLAVGVSRKSFIGHYLNRSEPKDRLFGGLAAELFAAQNGADIIRAHEIKPLRDALLMCRHIQEAATLGEAN